LTESGAITQYLTDTYSEESWTPEERATIARWSYFVITEIDATALYVIRRHEGLPNIYGEAPAAVVSSYDYAYRQFNVVSDALTQDSRYLVGDKFSVADIHLTTCIAWAKMLSMDLPSKLVVYGERLMARPAYQQASKVNGMPATM
jgi:glutathione S-transferase